MRYARDCAMDGLDRSASGGVVAQKREVFRRRRLEVGRSHEDGRQCASQGPVEKENPRNQ